MRTNAAARTLAFRYTRNQPRFRVPQENVLRCTLVLLVICLFAVPARAEPISINFEGGCLTSFPQGGAIWTSAEHFRFAEFWDLEAGCGATASIPVTLYQRFDDFDSTGGLSIHQLESLLPPCGRGQIDWQEYVAGPSGPNTELGPLGALVFNTGVNCSELPPEQIPLYLSGVTPMVPPSIPEPATLALLGFVVGWASWQYRKNSRHN